MSPIQITLLGLDSIGASIGLKLSEQKDQMLRIGCDRELEITRQAQKLGAVDKVELNVPSAVENADIVVLSLPLDEVRKTLKVIAPVLKEGCVVLDTSPVTVALAETAAEVLPAERHYINFLPSLNPAHLHDTENGLESARADLFEKGLFAISSAPGIDPDALKLAVDLCTLLGAAPFFADPYEMDGLMAANETLPMLAAAALLRTTQGQTGWRESRKITRRAYALGTLPANMLRGEKKAGQAALLNRENVTRLLDEYVLALQDLRALIAAGDENGLTETLDAALEGRRIWLAQRTLADWDTAPTTAQPARSEILGKLFGFRRKKD